MSQLYPTPEPVVEPQKDNLRENLAALVVLVMIAFVCVAPPVIIFVWRWAL